MFRQHARLSSKRQFGGKRKILQRDHILPMIVLHTQIVLAPAYYIVVVAVSTIQAAIAVS